MIKKTGKLFCISGKDISYIIAISDTGEAVQSYFGKKIKVTDNYRPNLQTGRGSFCTEINGVTFEREMTEYTSYGYTDMHTPMFLAENKDGNCISQLLYKDFKIRKGVCKIKGMPFVTENGKNAETLELTLKDDVTGLEVILSYVVFEEYNIIARSARLINTSADNMTLRSAYSGGFRLERGKYELIHFAGAHAREREMVRTKIGEGMHFDISNAVGGSGHNVNPFVMLAEENANEDYGSVYSMSLIYSGNHSSMIECDRYGYIRAMQGINPFMFGKELKPGEEFYTPQCILCCSDSGIGGISRELSDLYRNNLCRSKWVHKERPILINNWEATYFNFNEDKLIALAEKAKEAGIELFVLDDGWFGKRDNDKCSLGDWTVYKDKLPAGIDGLAKRITDMGLKFGLWFEPEMVSPDSELYRAHPDWAISVPGRNAAVGRNQYILDLSRDDVCGYIVKAVSDILSSADISYVKWDMNRNMSDMPRMGYNHEYILGLYKILSEITESFPDILFESCAGGGGRFDAGMLAYMPQIWTSDDTDAAERLKIQYSTSMGYPVSAMSAHVTTVPNHQIGRVTPLESRAAAAYAGIFGYELDITKLAPKEFEAIKEQIKKYKELRHLMINGDFYRIASPYEGNYCTWEMVSKDKDEVFVMTFRILSPANSEEMRIKLKGIDSEREYIDKETGLIYGGDELMYRGVRPQYDRTDFAAAIMHLVGKG